MTCTVRKRCFRRLAAHNRGSGRPSPRTARWGRNPASVLAVPDTAGPILDVATAYCTHTHTRIAYVIRSFLSPLQKLNGPVQDLGSLTYNSPTSYIAHCRPSSHRHPGHAAPHDGSMWPRPLGVHPQVYDLVVREVSGREHCLYFAWLRRGREQRWYVRECEMVCDEGRKVQFP